MAAGTLGSDALTKATVADDRSAEPLQLTRVYEENFRYVYRCLRSLGVRDAALDDALQDVFVVVQRRLAGFDGRVEVRTWLYAIAIRIARKYRARHRHENPPLAEVDVLNESADADAEGAVQRNERLLLARAALDALDEPKREVFVLARVEQMSAPEIAGVLGIPLNTVYSRLRAARQAFDTEVERQKSSRKRSE